MNLLSLHFVMKSWIGGRDIAKFGYTDVNLFFLFLIQNIDCGYSPSRFQRVPTINVLAKILIISFFPLKRSIFTAEKITVYCMGKFS